MEIVEEVRRQIREVMPWDLAAEQEKNPGLLLLDVREPYEFQVLRIAGSLNVPRGIVEQASEYGYDETLPVLADAREQKVVVICRSGYRSVLVTQIMQWLGYQDVRSLRLGLRGWSDAELPLVDGLDQPLDPDEADRHFNPNQPEI